MWQVWPKAAVSCLEYQVTPTQDSLPHKQTSISHRSHPSLPSRDLPSCTTGIALLHHSIFEFPNVSGVSSSWENLLGKINTMVRHSEPSLTHDHPITVKCNWRHFNMQIKIRIKILW